MLKTTCTPEVLLPIFLYFCFVFHFTFLYFSVPVGSNFQELQLKTNFCPEVQNLY